jgi:hypothetical protein
MALSHLTSVIQYDDIGKPITQVNNTGLISQSSSVVF